MAATFDAALQTDKDWVRMLTGDTDAPFDLSDESIKAILIEVVRQGASAEGAKYCAAAQAGGLMAAGWTASSGGKAEKTVSKLSIQYGGAGSGSAIEAYSAYLDTLKEKCTRLSLSRPAMLKAW